MRTSRGASQRRTRKATYATDDNFSIVSDEVVHPAEEALWSFEPEKDDVDKILYDGIVDDDAIRLTRNLT